jgi:hypothetical protein
MRSKWEAVLDVKPVPLSEHLLVECSKLFAKELQLWPPEVDEVNGAVATLLSTSPLPPTPQVFREAFKLARWDLSREHEAYDEYMRNKGWAQAGLATGDRPMLLFLSRFMEEQLLALGEATEGRVDRKAMRRVLDLTERAVLKVGEV